MADDTPLPSTRGQRVLTELVNADGTPIDADNPLPVDATLVVGDLEIGAVEIKDATGAARSAVKTASTAVIGDVGLVTSDPVAAAALASLLARVTLLGQAADGAAVAGNPVRIAGKDDSANTQDILTTTAGILRLTLETLISGEDQTNNLLGVLGKPAVGSGYATLGFVNVGAATAYSVKGTPGNLYAVRVTNANAAVRYLQAHNKATAPAGGDVPVTQWAIPAGTAAAPGSITLDSAYFRDSMFFSVGVALAVSTASASYTAATNGDHSIEARYF